MGILFKWNILQSLNHIAISICFVTNARDFDVAYVLWFIRTITLSGFLLSLFESLFAWYIIKIVYKRLIALNDALNGAWLRVTNIFVALLLSIIQSKSITFIEEVSRLSHSDQIQPEDLAFFRYLIFQ